MQDYPWVGREKEHAQELEAQRDVGDNNFGVGLFRLVFFVAAIVGCIYLNGLANSVRL